MGMAPEVRPEMMKNSATCSMPAVGVKKKITAIPHMRPVKNTI